jgi:hypothetical protein
MSIRVELTSSERRRYVHWWIHQSGLTKRELRQIATALWSDRVMAENAASRSSRAA